MVLSHVRGCDPGRPGGAPNSGGIDESADAAQKGRLQMRGIIVTSWLVVTVAFASLAGAQGPPIRIGDINSYSGIAAGFTQPYRQAVEMAVDEVNSSGGLLGRRVEVLFRDDKGNPAEAIKHAQELVAAEKVSLLAGTYLSNVGLAVSDFAKMHKVLFVAAEPLSEAITWSQGHRYTFRVRPNTHSQGRMLAERAGRLPHRKWAVIGPNYEYGRRAWETFWARLKELKPDVQVVGEHWPTLAKLEPAGYVTALLSQQPEALYVSLFGSDWLAFAREAGKRGFFQKAYTVGILLGEPEYLDPLKLEAPEGMLVTGYPWYDITSTGTPCFRGQVHAANRPASRGRRLGWLRHVPIHLRGDSKGAEPGHREARDGDGVAEGGDAHRAHYLPSVRSPVDHGRLGRHDETGFRPRGGGHGPVGIRGGGESAALGGRGAPDARGR